MHITLCKPGRIPVPAKLYGGSQRVIYWLGTALVELGHRVTLIAHPASHIPGVELRPLLAEERDAQAWLKLVPDSTDIVHCHFQPVEPPRKPFVWTLHGNGKPGQKFQRNVLFLSRSHAKNHGGTNFVYNGIDPSEYECSAVRENFAVFLGKARWDVKNFRGAVRVARRAGIELRVMGSRNWPFDLQRLLPTIGGVRYYGMLGGREKVELLSRARCLINPVRWEEPFGIAITEALASGCYVAGTPYGSLPEIVTAETGVLSSRGEELADVVRHPERFEPQTCRDRVVHGGFTHLDMARGYLGFYERVLTSGTLDSEREAPATRPGFDANQLLPWED